LRNIRSADDRVLQHLYLSASKGGAVVFDRPLLEVAEDLGLTHEAYYRALAMLARTGAIKRIGRTIRLIKSVTGRGNREPFAGAPSWGRWMSSWLLLWPRPRPATLRARELIIDSTANAESPPQSK
jgi:hypothetical protein